MSSNRTCLNFFNKAIEKFGECRSTNKQLEALPKEASDYRLKPITQKAKTEREQYRNLEHQVAVCQHETHGWRCPSRHHHSGHACK